jgi:hypothetical protein
MDAQGRMNDQPIRIAILLGSPLTENIFARIGMPYLAETFEVTIIDCALWVRVGMAGLNYQKYHYQDLVTVRTESEFEAAIDSLRPMFAIDFVGKGSYTRRIQNVLKRANTKYVAPRLAPVPLPNRQLGASLASWAHALAIGRRVYYWVLRGIRNENPLPPDIALLAGSQANDYWTASSQTILWTDSFDYFTLKELQRIRQIGQGRPRIHDGRFVLFIDDCLSLSMDYQITGQPRPIEPDEYFKLLLQVLNNIERSLSLPVVIAAHPNGKEVHDYASLFGNRAVYFDATAELALDCELVLTHCSTAVAYPVLLRKPIVALNTARLRKTGTSDHIDHLGRLLNCPVLFMETSAENCDEILAASASVDQEAYEKYEKSYITTVASSDTNPFQQFVRSVVKR